MTKRNYSNVATPLPLGVAVNDSATTLTVTSTTGYPAPPFILSIERGTSAEEVTLCTGKTSTIFTVTRGYDGTTPSAHGLGAMIEHTVSAIEYREANLTPVTTTERDALTGVNLWDGMVVTNTTTDTIERYDLGSTSWVAMARMSDVSYAVANHSHVIGDLPVAADNDSSAEKVVRSIDPRLSDARTPVDHDHVISDTTGLTAALVAKAPSADPTFTGTATFAALATTGAVSIGDADTDVISNRSVKVDTHQRSVELTYDGSGNLATVVEKSGATTVRTTTLNYSSGRVSTTVEVAGGKTITTTLTYNGSGIITGVARVVA